MWRHEFRQHGNEIKCTEIYKEVNLKNKNGILRKVALLCTNNLILSNNKKKCILMFTTPVLLDKSEVHHETMSV